MNKSVRNVLNIRNRVFGAGVDPWNGGGSAVQRMLPYPYRKEFETMNGILCSVWPWHLEFMNTKHIYISIKHCMFYWNPFQGPTSATIAR